MSVTFEAGHVAGGDAIEAERARLAPYLGLARAVFLLAVIGALVVAYYSTVSVVPVIATRLYGADGQEWPNIAVNFLEVCQIGIIYLVTFGSIALTLIQGVHYVANTGFFDPYWQVAALEYHEKEEVLRLAEKWPAVESYRVAIAASRDFVRGDLDLMRTIAEQAREAAYQEEVNRRLHQADSKLRQVPSSED